MEIREFRLSDYEEVIALWDKAGLLASRSDERNEIEKKLARDPDLFLVGIDAEAIVEIGRASCRERVSSPV